MSAYLTDSAIMDFMLAHCNPNELASTKVIDWYTCHPLGFSLPSKSAGSHIPLYSTITSHGSYFLSSSLRVLILKSSFSTTTISIPLSLRSFSLYSSSPSSHTIRSLFLASANCPIAIVSEINLVLPLSS